MHTRVSQPALRPEESSALPQAPPAIPDRQPAGSESSAPASGPQLRLRDAVEKHHDAIWTFIRRLGVAEAEVDDAVQRVFLVLADRLSSILPDSERGFLFGTALRVAADARRAARRRREDAVDAFDERAIDQPAADELTDQKRARLLVDQVLDQMPLDLRAVLILFEVEELSTAEIAELLELPMGTVGSRLRRAREDFQARVKRLMAARTRKARTP
jgi:RNA polymerase sigma-70 factor, ECF subfamily